MWLLAMSAVGCSSDATAPEGVALRPNAMMARSGESPPWVADAEFVGRAIAMGLSDAEVRVSVRNTLRASRLVDHRVSLQEFLTKPEGKILLQAAERSAKTSAHQLNVAVSRLPGMHFYVPAREQRRRWTGAGPASVAVRIGRASSDFSVFRADGTRGTLVEAINVASTSATFILAPEERTSDRISPQADVPGSVIQDANDGELGGRIIEYGAFGITRVRNLADELKFVGGRYVSIACDPTAISCDGDGGGGGGGGPIAATLLNDLTIIGVCDFGFYPNNCGNDTNEFEWHTYYSNNGGQTWTNRTDVQLNGVPAYYEGVNINVPLIAKQAVAPNERITTDIIEDDGSWQTDTWYGSPWTPDMFTPNTIQNIGSVRCNAARPGGGTYSCPPAWKEINQHLIRAII
jgi:hypothetical protein